MITGVINSKLRPIRIAFIVPPGDKSAMLSAIRINSYLWGGQYNPILPYYQRLPRNQQFYSEADNSNVVLFGQLKAYDPDFIVKLGFKEGLKIDLSNYREIKVEDITRGIFYDGIPGYGVGLLEILDYLIDEEYRYVHTDPPAFQIPRTKDSLLWASIFGGLDPALESALEQRLTFLPNSKRVEISFSNYLEFLTSDSQFLRRITNSSVSCGRHRMWNDWVFLFDDTKPNDILTYWNLRAFGWRILPIPIRVSADKSVRSIACDYIKNNYWPFNSSADTAYHRTTVLKSNSVSEEQLKTFGEFLSKGLPKKNCNDMMSLQSWVPTYWDDWQSRQNNAIKPELTSDKSRSSFSTADSMIEFPSLVPPFMSKYGASPRVANELECSIFSVDDGYREEYAEVIPRGGYDLSRTIKDASIGGIRCSTDGLVAYPSHPDFSEYFNLPKSKAIMRSWFKEKDWDIETSDNGYIVHNLLKQFRGCDYISWLTNEPVVLLIGSVAKEKWLSSGKLEGMLRKVEKIVPVCKPTELKKWFIESKIIRLGVVTKCSHCRQKSWYGMSSINEEVMCSHCLQNYEMPVCTPKSIEWSYKGIGAFSTIKGQQGGLAVILTIRSLKVMSFRSATVYPSFTGRSSHKTLEVDFAMFVKTLRQGYHTEHVIFGECKTYNEFEKRDFDRMADLADEFPGSEIVFSTLRRKLSTTEIKYFKDLILRQTTRRNSGKFGSNILILTGNELFNSLGPLDAWRGLGGKFERYGKEYGIEDDFDRFARVTQQLYIDLA